MPTVAQLEALLEENPEDTFLLYALAMELDNAEHHDRSLAIFDRLTHHQTPYVPAFFMSGQQLVRLGRYDEARTVIASGITQANAQNNTHAAREMTDFLASIDA